MNDINNEILNEINEYINGQKVIISGKQRNSRQYITYISGLADDLDLNKILHYLKKTHHCNGSIIKNKDVGEVMLLSGNQKNNVYNFLVDFEICSKDEIIVKGV